MYPEAGGSSSFARRAFNEFWSFFAAWARDAHLHGHDRHLGVLRAALHRRAVLGAAAPLARRHRRRRASWSPCWRWSTSSAPRSRRASTSSSRSSTSSPSSCSSLIGLRRRARPGRAGRATSTSAPRPTWSDFILAIPIGMLAYTGIETISNMAEEAKDEAHDDPRGHQPRAHRGVRHLLHAAGRRAVRAARCENGETTSSASPRRRAASPATRSSAWSRRWTSGRCRRRRRSTSACSPPRSCSWPRTRASSASRGSSTRWASTARCPTRCAACTRATARRGSASWSSRALAILLMLPGQETFLGSIYSFGALLSFTIAHVAVARLRATQPGRRSGPTAARATCASAATTRRCSRSSAASFTAIAFVVIVVLNPRVAAVGVGWLLARHGRLRRSTAAARGSTSPPPTRSRSRSPWSTTRRSTTPCSCTSARTATTSSSWPPRSSSPPASGAASTCSSPSPCPNALADRRRACAEQEARRRLDHRAGAAAGRRPRVGPLGEGPRRPGRAADHRGGAGHARHGGRHGAAAARRRRVAVRQDAGDRAGRAPVPRGHRVRAAARPAAARARGASAGAQRVRARP